MTVIIPILLLSVCLSDYYIKMLLLTHIVWSKWHICELCMKRNIYLVKKKKNVYSLPDMFEALTYLSPGDTVELRQIGSFMRFIF